MSFQYNIVRAQYSDLTQMQELLKENNQKPTIIINESSIFLLAKSGDKNIGMIGAEISGNSALIRSTAVLQPWRNKEVAKILVESLFEELKKRGKTNIFLFSRDTGPYWQKFGFVLCDVREVINHLPDANQVIGYVKDNSIWTDIAWHRMLD